jgi:hypothetical protein
MSGEAPQMVFGTTGNVKQLLDGSIYERFSGLDQGGKVAAEYVWLGGTMSDLRSKTKTLLKPVKSIEELPDWNYDGSSCGQAPGATIVTSSAVWVTMLSCRWHHQLCRFDAQKAKSRQTSLHLLGFHSSCHRRNLALLRGNFDS